MAKPKAKHGRQKAVGSRQRPPEAASARAERGLVNAALGKLQSGGRPTGAELSALKRFEKAQEEERRWQYLRSTPKKIYMQLAGRSARQLIDLARRLGFPYRERSREPVDLTDVIRWFHDFLAKHAQRISAADSDDPILSGSTSPALERYREERTKLARLERLQKEGELLPREDVHQSLGRIASIYRSAGDLLSRQFGSEAQDILSEALDDAGREIDRMFGE